MNNLKLISAEQKAVLKKLFIRLVQKNLSSQDEQELRSQLKKVPYNLVVEVEQELLQEGFSSAEIMNACDHHLQAVRENLTETATDLPNNAIQYFQNENKTITELTSKVRTAFLEYTADKSESSFMKFADFFLALGGISKHYEKKEQLLFPFLEKAGISGPSNVMWAKDDELRQEFKLLRGIIDSAKFSDDFSERLFGFLRAIEDMVEKEEKILFPMCREKFSSNDWQIIAADLSGFKPSFQIRESAVK